MKTIRTSRSRRAMVVIAFAVFLAVASTAAAAKDTSDCSDSVGDLEGYTVRTLKIIPPRWHKAVELDPRTADILVEKEPFSTSKLGNTMTAARQAYRTSGVPPGIALLEKVGGAEVSIIPPPCVRPVAVAECEDLGTQKCVDVTIRPYHVAVDFYRIGNNFLPIPRSNRPTHLPSVPKPLRVLNPTLGVNHDRDFGPSAYFSIETNISRSVTAEEAEDEPEPNRFNLHFRAGGEKSLSKRFYSTRASLSLSSDRPRGLWQSVGVEGNFSSYHEPFGSGERFSNQGRVGLNVRVKPGTEFIGDASVRLLYRFSNNRFFSGDGLIREARKENSLELRGLVNGRLARGFSRAAFWLDVNQRPNSTSYQRLAGLFGYSKEIPLALNRAIGLEVLAGAGRVSGSSPEYSRFYSGPTLANFLYVEPSDDLILNHPTGPLLRSTGKNSGGLIDGRGGTSYWHTNLNVSFPIGKLSRPLIPNESIDEEEDEEEDADEPATSSTVQNLPKACRATSREAATLKTLVKSAARNSFTFLRRFFISKGMSPDEAQKEAEEVLKEICPAVFYLADQANLWAIKPMFMFDVSHLAGRSGGRTSLAVGPAVQFVLVTARLEVGYMRALRPAVNEQKGNFVFRLTFQNLF